MTHYIRLAILFGAGTLALQGAPMFTVFCANGNVTGTVNVPQAVNCNLNGGGNYTGNVNVTETDSLVLIRLTAGNFSGTNPGMSPIVDAPYFLLGGGTETAGFNGTLTGAGGALTNGNEFFDESVQGTSFSNNPAIANWSGPGNGVALPIPVVGGPNTNEGDFSGSGDAVLFVRFNTGGGTAFNFPTSVDGVLEAPEPGTVVFALPALLAMLSLKIRRTRIVV